MSRHLEDWIDAYLKYTSNTEPRESFRRWSAISAIASVLQRKVYLPFGMETFFPNMYIILVGPPAARKGTAVKPARKMLDRLGIEIAADESSRQKLITRLAEAHASHSDKEGNAYYHCSLTIWASELTTFLGYGNIDLLTDLNKWFDCEDRFRYDTIKHGMQEVVSVWVNLMGCTTPDLLQLSMPQGTVGSGFSSRTVFVYEDNKGKLVIFPKDDEAAMEILTQDLGKIWTLCGKFQMESGFMEKYGVWREVGERNPPIKDPRLCYYLQRRHVQLLKLCMIYSASRGNDMTLRLVDFDRANKTLVSAERKMSYVFRGMGANPLGHVQLLIMKTIGEAREIRISELMNIYHDEVNRDDLGKIFATLQMMRYCVVDYKNGVVRYIEEEKR